MKTRKDCSTEPEDLRRVTGLPRAAVAGGIVVAALLAAMMLLGPSERAATAAAGAGDRTVHSSASEFAVLSPEPMSVAPGEGARVPVAAESDAPAAPDNHPPTF